MKRLIFIFLVLISGVGSGNAAIDYSQPLVPDTRTIALWHMSSITGTSGNQWVTSDPGDSAKDLKIIPTSSGTTPVASLVAAPTAALGTALYLSSVPQEAGKTSTPLWGNGYETVEIEGWVKIDTMLSLVPNTVETRNIVETDYAWWIQKWADNATAQIGFIVNFSDGSRGEAWVTGVEGLSGQWLHFTAIFDEAGRLSLNVFDYAGTYNQTIISYNNGKIIKNSGGESIYIGWKLPAAFDEMRVSVTTCPGGNLSADINKDCHVDFADFAELATQWTSSL